MYQGRRGGLAGKLVNPAWIRYYHGNPPGVPYMAIDPAISEKTTADETAIVVANVDMAATNLWGSGPTPVRADVYVRWVWHGRVGIADQQRIIVQAAEYYRPVAVGIEAVAYQSALVQLIESNHPDLPIEPVRPDRDKFTRFLGLAALYEFGRIIHHPSLQASAFEYQLTHIPDSRHDDMPDALAHLCTMAGITSAAIVSGTRPEGFR